MFISLSVEIDKPNLFLVSKYQILSTFLCIQFPRFLWSQTTNLQTSYFSWWFQWRPRTHLGGCALPEKKVSFGGNFHFFTAILLHPPVQQGI